MGVAIVGMSYAPKPFLKSKFFYWNLCTQIFNGKKKMAYYLPGGVPDLQLNFYPVHNEYFILKKK